jgi:hypothetical protein
VTTRHQDGKTRRTLLRAGLAALGGGVAIRAQAQDAQKIDQKVVQYQTTPKGEQKCSNCVNFEPPSACKIVSGTIVPEGWCIAFGPKSPA